jgi:hypothetical protein
MDGVAEPEVLGDRSHRFAAPVWVFFDALTVDVGMWLDLVRGEVAPNVLEAERPRRVVWSSLWPVSPDDTIEFHLAPHESGTEVRFIWRSSSPPDARGIAITRQRLNRKLGRDLREWADSLGSPASWDRPWNRP